MPVFKPRLRVLTAFLTAALLLLAAPVSALAAAENAAKAMPWDEMPYEHYDPTQFKDTLEKFTAAAEAGKEAAVLSLYDELYEEYVQVYTLDAISYIHNSQDVNDTYWANELVYNQTLDTELGDALCAACHQVMEGPCADAFAAHVGEAPAQEFLDYEPMSARELELTAREAELNNQYSAIMDARDQAVYTYDGEPWTLSRLESTDSSVLPSWAYYEILHGIYDVLAQDVGPLYLELVAIRTERAKLNGYEDFNHYAYEELYSRAYTPEQAAALFSEVRQISRSIYTSSVKYMTEFIYPTYDTQEDMLAALRQYAGRIDPVFDETWQFMTENGLCDLAPGAGRTAGAYTISLPAYDSEFIFSDDVGSYYALSTLFHEFGHFTAGHAVPAENLLTSKSVLDLAEIHSTGLELLVLPYYSEIYQEGADIARYCTLSDALATVTDQALFAEFEAQVYAHPDLTVDQLGQLYNAVSVQYGYQDLGRPDQTWINVPHFFESPDYIVSYVAAALASLQIWAVSLSDHQAAVDIYMDIASQGEYDLDYFQVLEAAGLQGFDTSGVATDVCRKAQNVLIALESAILG